MQLEKAVANLIGWLLSDATVNIADCGLPTLAMRSNILLGKSSIHYFGNYVCPVHLLMVSESRCIVKRHSNSEKRYKDYMENIERTPFGRRLYMARIAAGFSQEAAAKAVGMKSQGTLSEAEISGKRSGYTSQLAMLYKVNPVWLATGKGNREPATQPLPSISLEEQVAQLLAGMPEYYADAWISKVRGDAAMQRAKSRAAQDGSQQPEGRDHKKHADPPLLERRRASR